MHWIDNVDKADKDGKEHKKLTRLTTAYKVQGICVLCLCHVRAYNFQSTAPRLVREGNKRKKMDNEKNHEHLLPLLICFPCINYTYFIIIFWREQCAGGKGGGWFLHWLSKSDTVFMRRKCALKYVTPRDKSRHIVEQMSEGEKKNEREQTSLTIFASSV